MCAPPGWNDLSFNVDDVSKEVILSWGFTEVSVGPSTQTPLTFKNNMRAKRKQYGLQHRVTNTIHGVQGQTLPQMTTEISSADPDFHIWDKG